MTPDEALIPQQDGPSAQDRLQQARIAREQGRFAEARERFEALLADELTPALEASARAGLASVLHVTGQSTQALIQMRRALTLREQLGDSYGAAGMHLNLAVLFGDLSQYTIAVEHYEQAFAVLRGGGDPERLLILHVNYGRALIDQGDLERGERITREGIAQLQNGSAPRHMILLGLNLAEALRRRGQSAEALGQYQTVIEQSRASRMPDVLLRALHGQALLQAASGEPHRARELLFEALALARRTADLNAELVAMTGLAEVSLLTGQPAVAQHDAELVLARADEGQRIRFVMEGHDLMARASEMMGDYRTAFEHLMRARGLERSLHAQESEQRARLLSARLDLPRP